MDLIVSSTSYSLFTVSSTFPTQAMDPFESLKQEMRRGEHAIKRLSEMVEKLQESGLEKEQMRERYHKERELLKQRHQDEVNLIMGKVQEAKERERERMEAEGKLEIAELRQRIAALERQSSHAAHANERRRESHPLGHLFEDGMMSNPGRVEIDDDIY